MSLLNSINLPQSIVSTSHPQTKNMSPAIAEEANNIPSASTISQSASFPAHTSPRSTVSGSLIPNSAPTTRGLSMAPSLPNRPGVLGPPVGRNIHGIAPPIQIPSNVLVPSVATDSSSAVPRLSVPTTHAFNATVQSQIFSPYPSSAPMAAHPHGTWLQPPQVGGMTRPPFLPYPVAFPGPLPFPAHGMPLPSIPLPDPQPPGVTPVRVSPVVSVSSATSGHNHAGSSGMQAEITPSGMDNQNHLRDVASVDGTAMNEHFDAWTAHRSEEGAVYYYNALTRESTYDKPSGFKGEPEKVSVHPTPVSMVNLSGTDWVLVTASDGKRYYYNSKSKVSSWQIPYEVSELRKKQESEKIKDSLSVPSSNILPEKGSGTISLNAPAINTGGRDAVALRPSNVLPSSSTLDLIKKKLQDCGTPATSTTVTSPTKITSEINSSKVDVLVKVLQSENSKDKPKDPNDSGNMSDTSSDSEDEDSGPTKEECIIQFKEMLKERGVAPFSKWEKELPKILFDPRFKAIPSYSARRSLFEHYVKTRAEEERKEKRAAQKAAVEGFKKLLDEASPDIDLKTDYQTFRKKWGSDPRFEALDRKDREHLLNERVFSLKKAAKEKTLAVRAAATAGFKSMLREKGDITVNSRWSRVKDSLRDDPRYKSVKHEDREVFFNEFLSELKAAGEEAQRETKAKRDEEVETFEKLKEREREMHKRKEREEQEMERVRLKVRRKEAVVTFQALLVETIKDPQASWAESKPKLDKDPQGRAANPELDPSDTDKLFREHVKMLQERCAHEFRALLSEILTAEAASQATEDGKTVFNSWSMAKRLLKPDPRYNKLPRKERESMWHRCAEDMLRKLKSDEQWEKDKYDLKARASADPGRLSSGQRAHDRR